MGVGASSHTTTLLACFNSRVSFQTVHGSGQTRKNTEKQTAMTNWQYHRYLINVTPTQFTQQLVRYSNNRASQQWDNQQLWHHKWHVHVKHQSDSPRNTRMTPREPDHEITFITMMKNVEYICQQCGENFDTEQKYLYHRDQNHSGQRWKCHLCSRYLMRCLELSLHRALVHPYEPAQTSESSDYIGGLRPPRKPNTSARHSAKNSHSW